VISGRNGRNGRPGRSGRRVHALAIALLLVAGCGDLMTSAPEDGDLFDAPLPGLTREQQATFVRGDEAFGQAFSVEMGLGPLFNEVSCVACHSGDGRGLPRNTLVRFSRGSDLAREEGGPQLQTQAIPGALPETLPQGVDFSRRLPPPVFGVGLIAAIPEETILALADPDDANGDGISGRAHWVVPPEYAPQGPLGGGNGRRLGRFSRKAQVSSLIQQTSEAYHQDIGITTDFIPEENPNPQGGGSAPADLAADPELSATVVRDVVEYLQMLAPPAPGEETGTRGRGRELFDEVRCSGCHVAVLMTGPSPIAALANKPALLYSDLLLHDMGPELADNRPDGDASGSEWRTAPLWGLRLVPEFLDGQAFYLHDGRARTLDEAIRTHGGEAAASRDAFAAMPPEDRDALLDFVESR